MKLIDWDDATSLAYIASYDDLCRALGADPDAGRKHYARHGQKEGRCITFDVHRYIADNPDLASRYDHNETALIIHYIEEGINLGHMDKINGPYDQDGLRTIHNHEFMIDPVFEKAYARGVMAASEDYHWHWRVHIGLWAASNAAKLNGDFIEFGVNRGFLSSAIMHLLDWDSTGKTFYLLDTFKGIDEMYVSQADIKQGVLERNQKDITSGFYTSDANTVMKNFLEWKNIQIIIGSVPDTLEKIDAERFSFVHIDMNCSVPEIAAITFIWDKLVPGAFILLDDYAYAGFRSQKIAMDEFALEKGISIASLPTGQGLIIKV